jgi:nucleotide-binding universal stress UspA family protein
MRLLCATDLSPKCEFGIDRAGRLAEDLGLDLSLLHVVPPVESERALEESLNVAIGYMRSRARPPMWHWGSVPNVIVRTGSPARIIAQTVQRLSPFALVLGPRRRRGVFDVFEGSTAEKILQSRGCPVLIVQQPPKARYRKVLLAMDTSVASVRAMQTAETLLSGTAAATKIVHAYEPPYRGMLWYIGTEARAVETYTHTWKSEAAVAIRDLLKQYSADFTRYEILVEDAKPAAAILRAVESEQPDLLVLGTRSAGTVQRAFTGSVTSEVIHKVRCDVLIVPAAKTLKDPRRAPTRSGKTPRMRPSDSETPRPSFG